MYKFEQELKKAKEESLEMLANFVNTIGLDGDYYVSSSDCTVLPYKIRNELTGEYDIPGKFESNPQKIDEILSEKGYREPFMKSALSKNGLILINPKCFGDDDDNKLRVTIIHETIHSKRNLMIKDVSFFGENEQAYSFKNNKFIQRETSQREQYGLDPSQDILQANIDTSRKETQKYIKETIQDTDDLKPNKSSPQKTYRRTTESQINENFFVTDKKVIEKLDNQKAVDEALVELMSLLSFYLYSYKKGQREIDIWTLLKKIRSNFSEQKDVCIMSEIIENHHDLELFHWMIDPITYSNGDIHYDFFQSYINKEDEEKLKPLYIRAKKERELIEKQKAAQKKSRNNDIDR